MRLICYVHIGAINIDVTQSILDELFDRLHKSGLYKKLEEIRCGLVGQSARCILVPEKANVVFYTDDPSVYEIPTLNNMRDFALKNKDTYILYLHTKGATSKRCNGVNYQLQWSKLMQHFCIDRHEECISLLQKYMTVGCLMNENYYCGNFWWVRGDYVANKEQIVPDKSGWGM